MFLNYLSKHLPLSIDCSTDIYCLPLERDRSGSFLFTGGLYNEKCQFIIKSATRMNGRQTIVPLCKRTVHKIISTEIFEYLPGNSLYLGILHKHYGHFLCDTLSRLWMIDAIDQYDHILLFVTDNGVPKFVTDFFDSIGLSQRIRFVETPLFSEKIYIPQPSIVYPNFFHKSFLNLSHFVRSKNQYQSNASSDLLFVSRANLAPGYSRYIVGERLLEHAMINSGAVVISPEKLSIQQQFGKFNLHKRIVGYAGSAMHNLIFSEGRKNILYYSSRRTPSLYKTIDKLLANQSIYLNASFKPNKKLLGLKTGFRPEIIDVDKIASHLQNFMSHKLNIDDRNLAIFEKNMMLEYNTAVVIRYIVEQKSLCSTTIEREFFDLRERFIFDSDMIDKAATGSPVLRNFFRSVDSLNI